MRFLSTYETPEAEQLDLSLEVYFCASGTDVQTTTTVSDPWSEEDEKPW